MNWKEKIISKYPDLFEKQISFSCGEGWSWLIDNLCEKITNYVEHKNYPMKNFNQLTGFNIEEPEPENKISVTISYMREKFGVLDVFAKIKNDDEECTIGDEIWSYISFAAHLSTKICEKCGTTQHIGSTSGWIRNICVDCAETDKNRDTWLSKEVGIDGGRIPINEYKKKIRKDKLLKIKEND